MSKTHSPGIIKLVPIKPTIQDHIINNKDNIMFLMKIYSYYKFVRLII